MAVSWVEVGGSKSGNRKSIQKARTVVQVNDGLRWSQNDGRSG